MLAYACRAVGKGTIKYRTDSDFNRHIDSKDRKQWIFGLGSKICVIPSGKNRFSFHTYVGAMGRRMLTEIYLAD